MMRVTVGESVYEYDETKLLNTEAIALQKATGLKPPQFAEGLKEGDAIALSGLVWLILRRAGETVKFDDLEFDLASIDVEAVEEEKPANPT